MEQIVHLNRYRHWSNIDNALLSYFVSFKLKCFLFSVFIFVDMLRLFNRCYLFDLAGNNGTLVNGQKSMTIGHWSIVTGQWSLVNGQWSMTIGQCSLDNDHWSTVIGQ